MIKTCWKNLPLLLSFVPYVHFALLLDFRYHSVSGFITLIFLSLFAGYYFQRNRRIISLFIANIISTVTSYLFCANFTEWRYFYHPLKPTQLILLLAGIYLVPQILGSLWAVALSYKKASIKTNHICTKRSFFLLFIHIWFSYIMYTFITFFLFYTLKKCWNISILSISCFFYLFWFLISLSPKLSLVFLFFTSFLLSKH